MNEFDLGNTLNIELDVLLASIEGATKQLTEDGDRTGESIECALSHQFNRVKFHTDALQEYHAEQKRDRIGNPHGIFMKMGTMDDDLVVEKLERFRGERVEDSIIAA